jgi:hypothetical protein
MTLSKNEFDNIEWKMNALLMAGRQARAYAKKDLVAAQLKSEFVPCKLHRVDMPKTGDAEVGREIAEHIEASDEAVMMPQLTEDQRRIRELEENLKTLQEESAQQSEERFEAGYLQGKQETQDSLQAQYSMLDAYLKELQDIKVDFGPFMKYIEELGYGLAQAVIRFSASDADYYRRLIKHAMDSISIDGNQEITIVVNPQVQGFLNGRLADIGPQSRLVVDQNLELGDLKILMGFSEVEEIAQEKLLHAFSQLKQSHD